MKQTLLILLALLVFLPGFNVRAQGAPSCTFEPDGSITCTTGGGGEGGEGGGEGEEGGEGGECTPGQHLGYEVLSYDAEAGICTALLVWQDNCTGQMLEPAADQEDEIPCAPQTTPPSHPCDSFVVTSGGITCESFEWNVRANVRFPEIYLDVRPYPATLVRWPTAVRNGGLGESSGSGTVDYVPYGGGSPGNPQEGDWQNLRLTLTLRPAGMLYVSLPHIGDFVLPDQGATGTPMIFEWEVPSHPAAGGGPLAGSVGGLDELPGDMPLFVGNGRAPYRLFWELRYQEYTAIRGCVAGPGDGGGYNCGGGTGHREIVGYEWRMQSSGGEIPPSAVQNLPASVMADLNNDGTPDAYWDNNLTLRRMDDAGRVDNPRYQHSWNWGGTIYWAVREGQGQIGWPGQ
jgi:hypothetical protein